MKKQRAFTLIELIMVIVIIGILAAIAIPRYIDLRKEANKAACKGSGGALRAAIASFYASAAVHEKCGSTGAPYYANDKCWPTKPLKTSLFSEVRYVQEWPHSPAYYGGTGSWDDHYEEDTGALKVEEACPK